MKKMLLVDGNSLFFRAYYATAYTRMTQTSTGIYTNAVFGFASMLNKAIELVKPQAMVVAFDSGKKTFRHDAYEAYKGTRKSLPPELVSQFPLVREYCSSARYCYIQQDGLEADDIIGSLVKRYPDWDINVLSSDKDLLQLIDKTTSVWLIKKGLTEIEEMDEAALKTSMNLRPNQIPDLKGLMGDASDNIPGLPGVGEKTALKLIADYDTVENVIAHKDELKGKLKETVELFHEQAMFSKWLATIKVDGDIQLSLDDSLYNPNLDSANEFFKKYEMRTLIKESKVQDTMEASVSFEALDLAKPCAVFAHYSLNTTWPHPLLGLAISDGKNTCYLDKEQLEMHAQALRYLEDTEDLVVYDAKSMLHAQTDVIRFNPKMLDMMILIFIDDSSLNTYNKIRDHLNWPDYPVAIHDDAAHLLCRRIAQKLYTHQTVVLQSCVSKDLMSVYNTIEYPLVSVLYDMEKQGFLVDESVLDEIADTTLVKLNELNRVITQHAGQDFNINSPKQLGEILFTKLQLSTNRKGSTSIDVLESLLGEHPIIESLIEYRKYQKLYSTYAIGLKKFILEDSKIHTVYNQTTAQTGRLSSTDPNLQNISIKDEEARAIRKAFIASPGNVLFACDYSQIELRVLAHMANEKSLIEAFNNNIDIHTKTAMDVFGLSASEVNSKARRQAKAVNFGIIYGISDFGLATQIGTDRKTAKAFIERYLATYSGISHYMQSTIDFCIDHGYVQTLFGRRREIPEINDKSYQVREFAKRASMNAPIQGTAADIMKLAMIQIQEVLKQRQLKSKMIVQVHDELVFDVPQDELSKLKNLVEECMTKVVKLSVPLEVSSASGASWYEAK